MTERAKAAATSLRSLLSCILQAFLAATAAQSGIGAYTGSKGLLMVRQSIARFIEERDGFPADPEVQHNFICRPAQSELAA